MRWFYVVSATAFCGLAILQIAAPPIPRFIYNTSNSASLGSYYLELNTRYNLVSEVAAFAPEEARNLASDRGYLPTHVPLLKTIWAIFSDEICVRNGTLSIKSRLQLIVDSEDRLGRKMPKLDMCFVLDEDEFFLLSTDVQASWDSRYFGPVPRENILCQVTYLGPMLWSVAKRKAYYGALKTAQRSGEVTPWV